MVESLFSLRLRVVGVELLRVSNAAYFLVGAVAGGVLLGIRFPRRPDFFDRIFRHVSLPNSDNIIVTVSQCSIFLRRSSV